MKEQYEQELKNETVLVKVRFLDGPWGNSPYENFTLADANKKGPVALHSVRPETYEEWLDRKNVIR